MKKNRFTLILISSCLALAAQVSSAATIPAGTTLVVRTRDTISSHDRVGRTFNAQLDQDIDGWLKAGTKVLGKIETSRGSRHTSAPLTLNITALTINGRTIPIKTTGGFQPENKAKTSRQSRANVSVGSFVVPVGTKMEFRVAEPISL